ncbi:MAG: septum formation initiator family protein [Thermotaleaceae bacterium]
MRKSKKKTILKGNRLFYLVAIAAAVYVVSVFAQQRIKLYQFLEQEQEKQTQVAALKAEILRLEEEIKQGNTDAFVEKVARQQLKMLKPHEIIYIDMEKAKNE